LPKLVNFAGFRPSVTVGLMTAIRAFALAAMLTVSACATVDPPPADLPGEVIVYAPSYGPFCFGCVFMKLTVAEDGRVWIEREQDISAKRTRHADNEPVWRTTRELITVTPEQQAAFRSRLAPYRPAGRRTLNGDDCSVMFTDMPGTTVSWRTAGATDELIYDFGCDPEKWAAMRDDLETAPGLLGIVMTEQTWAATTRIR
jgi:hypothetical protein